MIDADLMHSGAHQAATRRTTALIVDPEIGSASPLVQRLIEEGLHVCLADSADAAKRHLRERPISFAVVELVLDDGDGVEIVDAIANSSPGCRTLVHSRFCNLSNAVSAIKAGASDVLPKPTETDFLVALLLDNASVEPRFLSSFPAPNSVRQEHIRDVYMACGANVARAARQLSMHRRTLQRLLKRSPML
ncbi:hypothetical protein ASE04_22480 [Rhizobium sp. Root708]|uniref:response regulator transcription factor n=1 Tax=Rhizobium sp. Root708 TaxID=1736592 RepID=UPI0006F3D82C|nr:response regulator [Rhizobium sp. Root708]KRB61141.1 hypothetical protein ASE04_22480 [Rhizobium sp. Root708]